MSEVKIDLRKSVGDPLAIITHVVEQGDDFDAWQMLLDGRKLYGYRCNGHITFGGKNAMIVALLLGIELPKKTEEKPILKLAIPFDTWIVCRDVIQASEWTVVELIETDRGWKERAK